MNNNSKKVNIVGGGISGLIAATVLEKYNINSLIIEQSDTLGGRIKTDIFNQYQLDHGFQVLLSSYEAAKKYLDYESLNLQKLEAGACIFQNGKQNYFGDPLRNPSLLFPTFFSKIGSLSDKIKIAKLNFKLQKKTIDSIFKEKETSTLNYLTNCGFSSMVIDNFFKPFFSGIFLETELDTSSRMFEFVFKMFGDGLAVIPKNGMQEIVNQLKYKLKITTIRFNSTVTSIKNKEIHLSNGEILQSDYTIIATEPNEIIENLNNQKISWNSCQNLYFSTPKRLYKKAFIGLIPDQESLINNIFYPTSIQTNFKGNNELLSVTVIKKHNYSDKELILKVKKELDILCKIKNVTFLKLYHIDKALPNLNNLEYELSPTETKLKEGIYLAGDVLLNASLNAAIISGERAALAVINAMNDS